jgi:hypothetical protein
LIGHLFQFLSGGIVKQFTDPLLEAHRQRLQAQNDADRLAAEREIASLEAARDIALIEAQDRFSATRIGRLLIVIPFGLWWSAIYLVQIINPWFGTNLIVVDVPPRIHDMALILIPAILIADAGGLVARRFRR